MNTLETIEAAIYEAGAVHRNHMLDFLRLQTTSDQLINEQAVKDWLQKLHADTKFSKVVFMQGEIDRILSDLHVYGHVIHDTIQEGQDPNFQPLAETPAQPIPDFAASLDGTAQVATVDKFSPITGDTSTEYPDTLSAATGPTNETQVPNLWEPIK